jgi:hypothetical protein
MPILSRKQLFSRAFADQNTKYKSTAFEYKKSAIFLASNCFFAGSQRLRQNGQPLFLIEKICQTVIEFRGKKRVSR